MSELFFAPASTEKRSNGWRPYDNLEKTVLTPVTEPASYGFSLRYAIASVWGITDGSANQYGDNLNSGSYVVFYTGKGQYPYVGKIKEYLPAREQTARSLWPSFALADEGNAPGDPWRHLITFEAVWSVDIPINEIRHWRYQPEDDIIRCFSRVPESRRRRVEKRCMSVKEWMDRRCDEIISLSVETEDLRDAYHFGSETDDEILTRLLESLGYQKNDLSDGLHELLINRFNTYHGNARKGRT